MYSSPIQGTYFEVDDCYDTSYEMEMYECLTTTYLYDSKTQYDDCFNNFDGQLNKCVEDLDPNTRAQFNRIDAELPWFDLIWAWFQYYSKSLFIPARDTCLEREELADTRVCDVDVFTNVQPSN